MWRFRPTSSQPFATYSSATTGLAQTRTGGYKNVPVTDAGVVSAAEFAAETHGAAEELEITVDEIIKAERQTVAGTNYRLCLQILASNPEEEVFEQLVQVTVFRDLKNIFSLKDWSETAKCR